MLQEWNMADRSTQWDLLQQLAEKCQSSKTLGEIRDSITKMPAYHQQKEVETLIKTCHYWAQEILDDQMYVWITHLKLYQM